jgi:5-methylcytosine-specific restriction endonuclease McrA
VSLGTIYYRFGPLKPFLAAFVQWKQQKMSKAELLIRAHTRRQREPIPVGIRYQVLRERDSTCDTCSRNPKRNLGTVLEIDHIVPVSKGGTNDASNLQLLCQSCNRGKGNKYIG